MKAVFKLFMSGIHVVLDNSIKAVLESHKR